MNGGLSELCLQCGLCCDGTLFAYVRLEPGERASLEADGVALGRSGAGEAVLPQPCACLEGTACRRYLGRPQGCARLVCLLAEALEAGEVRADEASAVVHAARRLEAALEAALPRSERREPALRRSRALAQEGRLSARAKDAAAELEAFLTRHFLGRARRPT